MHVPTPTLSETTIQCTPKGICSWDFILETETQRATTAFSSLIGEQGSIATLGTTYKIQKHGLGSGRWTLEQNREEVAAAHKTSAFKRTFELRTRMGPLTLRPESAVGRTFLLEQSGTLLARIVPVHPFTRRSTIQVNTQACDWLTITFVFWLAVLTWRRASKSSGS